MTTEPCEDFLVEIGTEELPPKSLQTLATAFYEGLLQHIDEAGLVHGEAKWFAAPRRLAVFIQGLATHQAAQQVVRLGPTVKAAYDPSGKPTKALEGFAKSCGVLPEDLEEDEASGKVRYSAQLPGKASKDCLPEFVREALKQLPVAKPMGWGEGEYTFIRPVHWCVMLQGEAIIPGELFGIKAGNQTYGHRFLAPESITLGAAKDYVATLKAQGKVMVDFGGRRGVIREQVEKAAESLNGRAVMSEALLDEVTSIVEWPRAVVGDFDPSFLTVPKPVIVTTLSSHQKSFSVEDKSGNILPHFVTVSHLDVKDMSFVKSGNEKVVAARLSDGAFFYENDLKHPLSEFLDDLKSVTFQKKLGSLWDKTQRVLPLAKSIGEAIGADSKKVGRAALLCKTDLLTGMVGEFPELQGVMGEAYAKAQGESDTVALALREYYLPRFSKDELPQSKEGIALALADRLDTLVGIFGIGLAPTGMKDPFALRRAALAVLRILIEHQLPLDVEALLKQAKKNYVHDLDKLESVSVIYDFMLDRLKAWYIQDHTAPDTFAAVAAKRPTVPYDFHQRIMAVNHFRSLADATALAAANKRVSNILNKQGKGFKPGQVNDTLLQAPQEKTLSALLKEKQNAIAPFAEKGDYRGLLTTLATLRPPIDDFFDHVMVMADDPAVRNNRLGLLAQLRSLFSQVADIALLQS